MKLHWNQLHPSVLNEAVRSGGIDAFEVAELAASIEQHGVLQPLTVWATPGAETPFEILLGERRWRAAKSLGEKAPLLPCILKEGVADETERLILMGVENLQRVDISPLEEAKYYQFLLKRLPLPEVIRKLGKPRSRINKLLSLLELAKPVQEHIDKKRIPFSAARHLRYLPPGLQVGVADKMVGRKEGEIKAVVAKLLANRNGKLNGTTKTMPPTSRPEAETVTLLVAILLGIIETNGELLARCADSISANDADLAEEAFDEAAVILKIISKVRTRRGGVK